MFAFLSLVLVAGGWTRGGATVGVVGPSSCPTHGVSTHVIVRNGYRTLCGLASGVISLNGVSYTLRGGFCDNGRLGFGVLGAGSAPHRGLYIVLAHDRAGAVDVIDGEVELIPGIRVALSGTAVVAPSLRRGTFKVFGRAGRSGTRPTGSRFTGSWNCG